VALVPLDLPAVQQQGPSLADGLECGGAAVVQTPYDTTELPTEIGEVLEVLAQDLESGWLWCRSRSGREGWVPVKTLEVSG